MRLSTVFELLLIFLLIAFAAYGRVIDRNEVSTLRRAVRANSTTQTNMGVEVMSLKQAAENVNKYCTCNANICNCCRNFNIPIVQLKGPGCASLQYLEEDKLAVQLSVGDNILTSTVVNGQKPKAVCFPMPGGLTKFCGRIYSIQREADNHFKACLGLELQSSTELEAALRVSCFRFGPDGVKLRPSEQLPIVEANIPAEDNDDDDDDDDIFGLGDDDDDDDDDEDEDVPAGNAVPDSSVTNNESEDDDDDDDDDVLGFGALLDILTGDDESNKKKKKPGATTAAPILPFTIPILTKPTVGLLITENNDNSGPVGSVNSIMTTPGTIGQANIDTLLDNDVPTVEIFSDSDNFEEPMSTALTDTLNTEKLFTATDASVSEQSFTETSISTDIIENGSMNKEVYVAKPNKQSSYKKVSLATKNNPNPTSSSINTITNDGKKPSVVLKPIKSNPAQTYIATEDIGSNEDSEEADDDDLFGTSDLDDDNDDEKFELEDDGDEDKYEDEDEDQKVDEEKLENIDANEGEDKTDKVDEHHEEDDENDLINDYQIEDEEEEDALLTELVEDANDNEEIKKKVVDNQATKPENDDADYGIGLVELLARKRHKRSGRKSKVMRL